MKSINKYYNLIEKLKNCQGMAEWYIYGAGIVAYDIWLSLQTVNCIMPKAIIVSSKNEKEKFFEPEKVFSLNEIEGHTDANSQFVIATPEEYHDSIIKSLEVAGFNNYIPIDADLEYEIMAAYFRRNMEFLMLEDIPTPINKDNKKNVNLSIYMAKCHVDRKLKEQYELSENIIPIQVGKIFTEQKICAIADNTGQNISFKNRNYSELTATYWVWKNTSHDYKGICHYRRYLVLQKDIIKLLSNSEIDIITQIPFICQSDISQQYGRYITNEDFNCLMRAIKDTSEQDYELAQKIYKDKYIYNYNMLVARREIFDNYSEWMFNILKRAEEYCDPFNNRADRYSGYLGELLTTLYMLKNKDILRIYHVKKIWKV